MKFPIYKKIYEIKRKDDTSFIPDEYTLIKKKLLT